MTSKDTTDGWEKRFYNQFGYITDSDRTVDLFTDFKSFISQELTAYGDKRYEEGYSKTLHIDSVLGQEIYEKGRKEARKEVVEWAVKYLNDYCGSMDAGGYSEDFFHGFVKAISTLEELK